MILRGLDVSSEVACPAQPARQNPLIATTCGLADATASRCPVRSLVTQPSRPVTLKTVYAVPIPNGLAQAQRRAKRGRKQEMAQNVVQTWRSPHLPDTLFLRADFRQQRFDKHFHE